MRFENLFDDLSGQLENELGLEEAELHAQEERLRLGRLALRDRMRVLADAQGPRSAPLRLWLADGTTLRLRPATFGRDWVSGVVPPEGEEGEREASSAHVVVPLDAVASVALDPAAVARSLDVEDDAGGRDATPRLIDRLGLAFALRDLARRRCAVIVQTRAGVLGGTIDRVALDHLDLAVHEAGSPRRARNVREVRLIPLAALLLVRV